MIIRAKASIDLVRVDDGRDGIPGKPGADGRTPYLHIAYANSADGKVGFSVVDGVNKSYIGQYTDFVSADSGDPSKYKWTKIKGADGANGVGISSIEDQYYQSSSNTQLIGGSWLSAYPAWVDGKYLWTRYYITYTNGMTEQTAPVCMTGPQGNTGANGIGVSDVDALYAQSTSNTIAPTSGWSSVPPVWVNGKYVWSKTVVKYTNGTSVETPPVCLTGSKGEDGKPGIPGADGKPGTDGKDGKMLYGTCSTAQGTTAKVATVDGFSLYSGVTVSIKFTYPNTASNPTLNVNGSGAKPIVVNGSQYAYWERGASVNFVYDGTNWNVCSIPVYANEVTVGNPLGGNVHIDNNSIDMRDGSTVLSTFTPSLIELGKNSANSVVRVCGDTMEISTTKRGSDSEVSIKSLSSDIFSNYSKLRLTAMSDGPDAELLLIGEDSTYPDNPFGRSFGTAVICATQLYMDPGEKRIPLHDGQGNLTLVNAKAKDATMPPRWVRRCGWVQLQGRVITTVSNAVICDLKPIIDPLDIPPAGVNRNFACFTSSSPFSTNVFINSSGQLVASEARPLIDLSAIQFRAK